MFDRLLYTQLRAAGYSMDESFEIATGRGPSGGGGGGPFEGY